MKTRWGILSTANIGVTKVIPALLKASNCEIVAIASRSIEKAAHVANTFGIPKAYGSYDEMLCDEDIDVIYNPLPNHLHTEYTAKACIAGKHVLCEKPIAMSSKDIYSLKRKLFYMSRRYVMEAFMYKFHPQWIKTKQLVGEGAIGEVKLVNSIFSYFNLDAHDIRNKVNMGGGALFDIGCYCVSFARFIYEKEPVRVFSYIDRDKTTKIDKLTSGILDFGDGKSSTFTCSTQLSPYQRVQIFGTKGRIEIEIPVNAPSDRETRIFLYSDEKTEEIVFPVCDQYTLQVEQFSDAILNKEPLPFSINDSVLNINVIDALFKSSNRVSWIKL